MKNKNIFNTYKFFSQERAILASRGRNFIPPTDMFGIKSFRRVYIGRFISINRQINFVLFCKRFVVQSVYRIILRTLATSILVHRNILILILKYFSFLTKIILKIYFLGKKSIG